MTNKITVAVDFIADKANAAIGKFRGEVEKTDKTTSGFSGGFKNAMSVVSDATIAGFGVGQIVSFATNIINTGVTMEAMKAKAETVFGSMIGTVRTWSEENAAAMGLTATEAVNAGASIADLLIPMGFTKEAATENSLKLLDMAGALSAWSGGTRSAAEVSGIFTKAMLGEREELKSLGISISEADVQARLAVNGQKDLTGAALAQAKALATQQLIYEKSTDAQTAWTDGSMDSVKSANESKAALANLNEVLVTSLYPTLVELVPLIAETAEALVPLAEGLADVSGAIETINETAEKLTGNGIIGWCKDLLAVVFPILNVTTEWGRLTDENSGKLEKLYGAVGLVAGGLPFLGKAYTSLGNNLFDTELKMDGLVSAVVAAKAAEDEAAAATEDLGTSAEEAAPHINTFSDAANLAALETAAAEQAARDAAEAVRHYQAAIEAMIGVLNADTSLLNLKTNFDNVKEAATTSFDAATSGAADAEQKARDHAVAVNALKEDVITYGSEVLKLPQEQITRMVAQIDQGSLDDVEARLEFLSRYRVAVIGSQLVSSGLRNAMEGRGATGGIINRPTVLLAGEDGPEALIPLSRTSGNSPLPTGGGRAGNNYTIVLQSLMNPDRTAVSSLMEQIRQLEQEKR